jgi:toxin ParE1/3/4
MSAPNLPVILSPAAQDDFAHILLYTLQEWGAEQRDRYEAAIDRALALIGENPHLGRARDDVRLNCRAYLVEQHIVLYEVRPQFVWVFRIRHQRSNPRRLLRN